MKKQLLIVSMALLGVASTTQVKAQLDAATIMKGGVSDANTLMNAYMSPMMKAFGAGLNAGWFQTAKPHGIGGFDVTISLNPIFIPTEDQTYKLSELNFVKLKPNAGNTSDEAPTIFGKDDKNTPKVDLVDKSPFTNNDTPITSFNLPPGLGLPYFGVPTAQFSVGVGFGTEVGIRYLPTINAGDVSIGMFGFAVKHDVKQWIPVIKEMPFDLSAMFGYTSITAEAKLDLKAESGTDVYNPSTNPAFNNQKMMFDGSAWTFNALLSKKLGPLTPYMGLGYQASSVSLALKGDYPVTGPNDQALTPGTPDPNDPNNPTGKSKKVLAFTDPVSIDGKLSGFRATFGVRLKLLLLTIHGDYTLAAYNTASVGIGLNLQSIVPFKL